MKRLGPELKLSELKAPPFLSDLYWDLRDRRLLPLMVLVVVAIAAVPFLLGGGSEEELPPPAVGGPSASTSAAARAAASSLTVVEAEPGLRDYRKRLEHRKPTDPFEQQYTAPRAEGAELGSPSENSSDSTVGTVTTGSTGSSTSGTTTTTGESSPATPSPSEPPSSGGGKPHLTFFTWAINVWIKKSGGADAEANDSQEPAVKHEVLPQTALPGEKAPVVTYMGLSRTAAEKQHDARALLLVSSDVKSISGETTCVSRPVAGGVCQLLEAEPGFPVTFVYGANETQYTIKILKIGLVVTGHS